jgi:hypothetical protein
MEEIERIMAEIAAIVSKKDYATAEVASRVT